MNDRKLDKIKEGDSNLGPELDPNDSGFQVAEYADIDDFYERSERVDGRELPGFVPTLEELVQIVKYHIQDFLEMHWGAFVTSEPFSEVEVEDAIWCRLDKVRRVMSEDDFRRTVEVSCIQFGLEVDANLWEIFLHGDEAQRRAVAHWMKINRDSKVRFDWGELAGRIRKTGSTQREEIPPEVLLRMVIRKPSR